MENNNMVIRIQSADGTKRIKVSPTDSTSSLFEKVVQELNLKSYEFSLYQSKGRKNEIASSRSKSLQSLNIKHGDMIYLESLNGVELFQNDSAVVNKKVSNSVTSDENMVIADGGTDSDTSSVVSEPILARNNSSTALAKNTSTRGGNRNIKISNYNSQVIENDVDQQLWQMDGKIRRKRDPKFCHHGSNACCVHCSPLEPYDESYMTEQNIKHMSFHSYLRKLTAGADGGKFVLLEDISCRIKSGCKEHPPWPKGICSKCQPSAITLNRQTYRHVDHVMFENSSIVENFLNYWRVTGHQRAGLLFGKYEIHSDVPLGIRAVVAAIYEIAQDGCGTGITLLPDKNLEYVKEMALKLGLTCVGWIFTDLVAEDVQTGTVKCIRGGVESYFLTSYECIMAGYFQNLYPNSCRFSPSGYFGSKFVTVCITGDKENKVHMEGYSVSNQCMALVREGILVPTIDCPGLGYIKESSDKQYVPDVYYKTKDNYGNEVTQLARPLPVEYLLVDVPTSTPLNPRFTFPIMPNPFPIENRHVDGNVQDFTALTNYFTNYGHNQLPIAITDFHVLLYLATNDIMPLKDYIGPLLESVRNGDTDEIKKWLESECWHSLEQLMSASIGSRQHISGHRQVNRNSTPSMTESNSNMNGGGNQEDEFHHPDLPNGEQWTCQHCTFLNTANSNTCDMCGLPTA